MLRAYHFPFEDLRSDEDTIAGNSLPWRIGEIRAYTPITIDAGDGETISEPGYRSSPTLWDAFLHADGPIACLVEVSELISTEGDLESGFVQISSGRRLLAAIDIRSDLRLFACDCAERVLYLYETAYPSDDRSRKSIQIARDHARGRATAAELRSALVLAEKAEDAAPLGSAARWAAGAASGSANEEPHDAAVLAIWTAGWAVDGKEAAGAPSRSAQARF